jgi:hypothetical protein
MNPQNLFLSLGVHPNLKNVPESLAKQQIERYMGRQRLLRDVALGRMNPDDYLDSLGDAGVEVDDYLDNVDEILRQFL